MVKVNKYVLFCSFVFFVSYSTLIYGQGNGDRYLYHTKPLHQKQNYETFSDLYLFHAKMFKQIEPVSPLKGRPWKIRLEAGIPVGFYNADPHLTNSTQSNGGYTLGLREEIPFLSKGSFLLGIDYYNEGVSFNSYYFEPGYSFLYNGDMIYNHTLTISEFHFPILYKYSFASEYHNIGTFYTVFGWMYRLITYDNDIILNAATGKFVWEGQNNISFSYPLLSNQGSSIFVLALGYQHNYLRKSNAYFIELEYMYGTSPINYSGNSGSNNINFTLNTLAVKIGIRL